MTGSAQAEHPDPITDIGAADRLCFRLSETMDSLIAAIEKETELVRRGRLAAAGAIQGEKARLARQYVVDMDDVKSNSVQLGRLVPEKVSRLQSKHQEFRSLLQINLAVLATAREVSEDIIKSVAERVGARSKAKTYGTSGAMPSEPADSARGIAVDTSL